MVVFYFIVVAFVFYLYITLFDHILTIDLKEWMGYAWDSLC